ncbi:MAG: type II toxin-antitoxin system HicB family antitoxin [Phycisphaerae bacterium]|nr:type II toxin-antitoxin system HicB family antitoxin [Phycisphaerae bacterium]
MMTYSAKITKQEGCYLVSFPEFPNVNTYGETPTEARKNAHEALNGAIESDFERGFDLPKPRKRRGRMYCDIPIQPHIEIAYKLRKIRNGRPQTEIARKLNVSYQAYQKLENPRKCNPTIKTLEKISNTFGKQLKIDLT